jgi:hypothetical protein
MVNLLIVLFVSTAKIKLIKHGTLILNDGEVHIRTIKYANSLSSLV